MSSGYALFTFSWTEFHLNLELLTIDLDKYNEVLCNSPETMYFSLFRSPFILCGW